MSKNRVSRAAKKAAIQKKNEAMSAENYKSSNKSKYAKKIKRQEKNPLSPFYAGKKEE